MLTFVHARVPPCWCTFVAALLSAGLVVLAAALLTPAEAAVRPASGAEQVIRPAAETTPNALPRTWQGSTPGPGAQACQSGSPADDDPTHTAAFAIGNNGVLSGDDARFHDVAARTQAEARWTQSTVRCSRAPPASSRS